MKPQNRSIRDFFNPGPSGQQKSLRDTPQSRETSSKSSSSLISPTIAPTTAEPDVFLPAAATASSPATQPPTTSQTSAKYGASKRTVSQGQEAVLNSDSDSDSLPDLGWGQLFNSSKTSTATAAWSKRSVDDEEDKLRKPRKKGRNKKFDLLAKTAQKNTELEQTISSHKAELEKIAEEYRAAKVSLNENTLAKAIGVDDDPDQAHRLFRAMRNTNAIQTEKAFHFFSNPSTSTTIDTKFPFRILLKYRWANSFRDPFIRDQSFLTGSAYQIFRLQELPPELASWMIDQICVSQDELLSSKYMDILDLRHDYMHTLLDCNRLDTIILSLGGDVKSLDMNSKISRTFDALADTKSLLPHSLSAVVKLLQRASPWLQSKARLRVLHVLCYICIDDRVLSDANMSRIVQEALETTVCSFADQDELNTSLNDVFPCILSGITDPVLQRNLVCSFPAQSPLTAHLQRYLAFSFLLKSNMLNDSLSSPQLPARIHKYLDDSPDFRINKHTNHDALSARLTLLDIAIGPGLLSVPYQPLLTPQDLQAAPSSESNTNMSHTDIKDFNHEVDALAQHIKVIGNSIVEASASVDLTILEAKDCVERLTARLENAVRIGGKKAHHVFGDDESAKQLRVTDIFQKAAEARQAAGGNGIFADEDSEGDNDAAAQIQAEESLLAS